MSYAKERAFFLNRFGKEFPSVPYSKAIDLLRCASGLQRISEIQCSIEVSERETARLEKREQALENRVSAICAEIGAGVQFNGDPRGFPFILGTPSGETYDWGGRGLGVPGRGLPARCFA